MNITQELIAAIIAYPMGDAGFTADQRQRMAEVFAANLRIKNQKRFVRLCQKVSERFPEDGGE